MSNLLFAQDPSGLKHVLTFFQAADCTACTNFKPHWPGIRDTLRRQFGIDVEDVQLETKTSPIKDPRYPE